MATGQAIQHWSSPRNVLTSLYYPINGLGAVVTYFEAIVVKSSNVGRAYVVGGGIGQRQIKVVIEARSTHYFRYRAFVYGQGA